MIAIVVMQGPTTQIADYSSRGRVTQPLAGTHSTGSELSCRSLCGVEPSIALLIGLSPDVPTTISLASHSSATRSSASAGLALTTSTVASTPSCWARSSA